MSKQFDPRELGTVLAALRFYQEEFLGKDEFVSEHDLAVVEIATNCDSEDPMTAPEIDALCDRLNVSPDPLAIPSAADLRKSRLADAGEDMLAALDLMAHQIEARGMCINMRADDPLAVAARAVRDAIAKAKGEEIDGSNANPNGDDILFQLVQMHTHSREFYRPEWREASEYLIAKGRAVN